MQSFIAFDRIFVQVLRRSGIPVLRVCLGIVFFWFGALKVLGVSPVAGIIHTAYPFMPYPAFILVLGIWEVLIGIGLIFNIALRATLALLWLQMLGTLTALILAPSLFFADGNIFLLRTEGEFVIKNLVLIAAGMVIGGFEVPSKEI